MAEYLDEAKKLDLAPGWHWPKEIEYEDVAPDGAAVLYGVNAGRVDAAWYWHCSWGRTFFETKNEEDRNTAFTQLMHIQESAFYRFGLLPADRAARDEILRSAQEGDTTSLYAIIDSNCPARSK